MNGICQECQNSPKFYDFMYLMFIFNMSLIINLLFVDTSFKNIDKKIFKNSKLKYEIFKSSKILFSILKIKLSFFKIENIVEWPLRIFYRC